MSSLDWGILLVAGLSLVFAFIAFRQVMSTSRSVDGFLERADRFLNQFQASAKGVFSPAFVAETITRTLTKDIRNPDGTPVNMPQFINGYINAYGPTLMAEFKSVLPKLVPLLLNPPTQGPQNPGRALAQQRWGSGGLNAAKALSKAGKAGVPFAAKVGEYVEGAQALVQLVPAIKGLKDDLSGLKGGGDNGGSSSPSTTSTGEPAWGPPI